MACEGRATVSSSDFVEARKAREAKHAEYERLAEESALKRKMLAQEMDRRNYQSKAVSAAAYEKNIMKATGNVVHITPDALFSIYDAKTGESANVYRADDYSDDVAQCFRVIIEDREVPEYERVVDGYAGFLFTDKNDYPEVAMHWEHRFNHMVKKVQ